MPSSFVSNLKTINATEISGSSSIFISIKLLSLTNLNKQLLVNFQVLDNDDPPMLFGMRFRV